MIQQEEMLCRMAQDMLLRGFADSTQENYLRYAGKFLTYVEDSGGKLEEETIRAYLEYLLTGRKLTPGTVTMYNASIRFLFEVTLNRGINHKQVPRLREKHDLPTILTKEELRRIFEQVSPLRNKAILMTIYGGGLRVSEACALRVSDIDSKSMRIFVSDSKGGKDRYTLLSQANLEILREYWLEYRPRHPDGWLFLNKDGTRHAQKRMVQMALERALACSGIHKDVSVHSLRASFATHLLEAGVDIFTVKRLLGHAGLKSLSRYLGVTKFESSLKSPLDSLPKKRGRKPKSAEIAHA